MQSSFPINLNLFYVKNGEPLTKTLKLSTVSRPVVWSVFPGIVLNQRIRFAVLMLKSKFNFLGLTMKYQK